jgi:outer membrane protein insertion porin family
MRVSTAKWRVCRTPTRTRPSTAIAHAVSDGDASTSSPVRRRLSDGDRHAGIDYGWPISEFQSLRAGLAVQKSDLFTDPNSSAAEAEYWVQNNGNTYTKTDTAGVPPIEFTYYGTKFNTFELSLGWSYDSRNRSLFADRGSRHRVGLSYTLPGSDVEFYTFNYDYLQFLPVSKWFTFMVNTELGYGKALGDTTSLPPYRNFFAGGPESVRGFARAGLGPKDSSATHTAATSSWPASSNC